MDASPPRCARPRRQPRRLRPDPSVHLGLDPIAGIWISSERRSWLYTRLGRPHRPSRTRAAAPGTRSPISCFPRSRPSNQTVPRPTSHIPYRDVSLIPHHRRRRRSSAGRRVVCRHRLDLRSAGGGADLIRDDGAGAHTRRDDRPRRDDPRRVMSGVTIIFSASAASSALATVPNVWESRPHLSAPLPHLTRTPSALVRARARPRLPGARLGRGLLPHIGAGDDAEYASLAALGFQARVDAMNRAEDGGRRLHHGRHHLAQDHRRLFGNVSRRGARPSRPVVAVRRVRRRLVLEGDHGDRLRRDHASDCGATVLRRSRAASGSPTSTRRSGC